MLLEEQGEWRGSASELLTALEGRVSEQVKRDKAWPKNPQSLTGHLKRLAPNLRTMGWVVEKDRTSKKRSWTIRRVTNDAKTSGSSQASSFASQDGERESMPSDADRCDTGRDDAGDANDANAGELWDREPPWNPDKY